MKLKVIFQPLYDFWSKKLKKDESWSDLRKGEQ